MSLVSVLSHFPRGSGSILLGSARRRCRSLIGGDGSLNHYAGGRPCSINNATDNNFVRFLSSTASSSNNSQPITKTTVPPAPTLFIPRSERHIKKPLFDVDELYEDRLVRLSRTEPTRELNYTAERWNAHESVWRRFRHMFSFFGASTFQRLLYPELTFNAVVGCVAIYYNEWIAPILVEIHYFEGATTVLSLLVAFRLNTSYGRYVEARAVLGEVNNTCRDLASQSLMVLDGKSDQERMLRLIKAFPICLHWHLNQKGGHYRMHRDHPSFQDRLYAEYYAELNDVFGDQAEHLDFEDLITTYRSSGHVPLTIIAKMRSIIANNSTTTDPMYKYILLDNQVSRLTTTLGQSERILRTPIPTSFTRHTSRLLFLWSTILPLALYSSLGPIWTVPTSLTVVYSATALEDISVQLEEPFSILPLRQYSEGIYDGVNVLERTYRNEEEERAKKMISSD